MLPHSRFPRSLQPVADRSWDTEQLLEGDEKAKAVQEMFDVVAPRYDVVNRIMTFRLDTRWRRTAIAQLALPTGSTVRPS